MTVLTLLFVAALSGLADSQVSERDQTSQACFGKVADIFFVLDSSSSIYIEDYRQELQFTREVVTRFDLGSEKMRVGALTFSDDFQVGIGLGRLRSKGEILAAIDERNLPYRTGITNTDTAIRHVRNSTAFRQDITKVIIVVTDGGSRSPGSTALEAEQARDDGFYLFVVGAGQYLDENEWRSIASDPDSEFIFNITNFRFLNTLKDILPRRICLLPPLITRGNCGVQRNGDIFFLAAPNGVNDALDVATDIADNFRFKERLRVQYFMDACDSTVDNGFQGPDRHCRRFGNVLETTETTFTSLLTQLRSAATNLRATRQANQVAVLFIDDQSMLLNRFSIVQGARNAAQIDGIELIIVDLGVRQYSNFVNGMAQNQENIVDYFGLGMSSAERIIVDRICQGINSQ